MAIPNADKWQSVTIAAKGTGSLYFTNIATPYVAIQILPLLAATSYDSLKVYYSNFSPRDSFDASFPGDANTPVTSSQHAYLWAGPDANVTGAVVPTSAFVTSSLYNISQVCAKHLRADVSSESGGTFIVYLNRKG